MSFTADCTQIKMKPVLVWTGITFFAVVTLLHGVDSQPCTYWGNNNDYNKFSTRHILQEWFDRKNTNQWQWYLEKYKLWCRVPKQTFVESSSSVESICTSWGRAMSNPLSNLCTSRTPMVVFDVFFDNNCRLQVQEDYTYVTVACNIVANECLPVHLERNPRDVPIDCPCTC